uniref:Uncharacterized protein n=1 Tax=Anguilla anguilla TaxID=7936 RepID=A0A0E9TKA8_ANGAN
MFICAFFLKVMLNRSTQNMKQCSSSESTIDSTIIQTAPAWLGHHLLLVCAPSGKKPSRVCMENMSGGATDLLIFLNQAVHPRLCSWSLLCSHQALALLLLRFRKAATHI